MMFVMYLLVCIYIQIKLFTPVRPHTDLHAHRPHLCPHTHARTLCPHTCTHMPTHCAHTRTRARTPALTPHWHAHRTPAPLAGLAHPLAGMCPLTSPLTSITPPRWITHPLAGVETSSNTRCASEGETSKKHVNNIAKLKLKLT
jgi:hypothetical protein